MATRTQDIDIRFGSRGENAVIAALGRVRTAATRVGTPMVNDLARLRQVAGVMSKIGVAATGIAGAGLAGVAGSLSKARDAASSVSEELKKMRDAASGMSVSLTEDMGSIAFAMNQIAGWEGVEEILGAGGAIMEQALEVKNYNEDVISAWQELGIHYEDLFVDMTVDEDGKIVGDLRGIDEILLRISDRIGGMTDGNILEKLIPLFGASDGAKIAAFIEADSSELRAQMQLYKDLTGFKEADVDASVAYRKSLSANEAAMLGLRVAFTRELFPVLEESNKKFQDFSQANQGRVGALGRAFADFIGDIEPLLMRAADLMLSVAVGDGIPEDTPLTRALAGLLDMIRAFKDGIVDVLDYLTSGQTDAKWLQDTLQFFADLKESVTGLIENMRGLYGTIADDVGPAIGAAIDKISGLLEMLGIDDTATQLAVVGGLVLFSNTLLAVTGLVAKLTLGLGKLAGAAVSGATGMGAAAAGGSAAAGIAAGAATGAALVGGAAYLAGSTKAMEAETEKAAAKAEELAKTHGEAYAAAYLRAFLDQAPDEHTGFRAANWLANRLGFGVDGEKTKAELDVIIAGGDASQAIAGAAEAFRDFGWSVESNGQIEIGAGITVSGIELAAAAQRQIDNLSTSLRIEGAAADLAARSSPPTVDAAGAAASAADQAGPSGRALTPVIIQIGQTQLPVLHGTPDAIDTIARSASLAARSRS